MLHNNLLQYRFNEFFQCDDQVRLTKRTDAVGRVTELFYDGNGNVIKEIDPSEQEKTFTYDSLNCLTKKVLPGNVYELAYDMKGMSSKERTIIQGLSRDIISKNDGR